MTLSLHWFLPTSGDARAILGAGGKVGAHHRRAGDATGERAPDIDYLGQIARSAEQLGFEAALTPTGSWCEDAWVTTAGLTQVTKKLDYLVAFRPGLTSPTLAAQMAASFQRISGGRLRLNVVAGGDETEQQRFGDFLGKDDRYARADDFLAIVRGAWNSDSFDYDGEHIQVRDAQVPDPPEWPPIYFGGSSPPALKVAARHADVYLTWGEPPELVAEKLGRVRELADAEGRAAGLRHPPAHDHARDVGGGVGGGRQAAVQPQRGRHQARPGEPARVVVGGPEADAGPARRQHRRAGDLPQPVGGRGPGPRRRGHRAGGLLRGGGRPHRRVPRAGPGRVHPVRLPPPGGGLPRGRGRAADPARAGPGQAAGGSRGSPRGRPGSSSAGAAPRRAARRRPRARAPPAPGGVRPRPAGPRRPLRSSSSASSSAAVDGRARARGGLHLGVEQLLALVAAGLGLLDLLLARVAAGLAPVQLGLAVHEVHRAAEIVRAGRGAFLSTRPARARPRPGRVRERLLAIGDALVEVGDRLLLHEPGRLLGRSASVVLRHPAWWGLLSLRVQGARGGRCGSPGRSRRRARRSSA